LSARPPTSEQNRARTLYAATSAARIGRIPLAVPTAAGSFGSRAESAALPISIKTGRIPLPWPYKLRSSLESLSPSPLISPPSPCARTAPLLDSYLGLPSRQRSGRGWMLAPRELVPRRLASSDRAWVEISRRRCWVIIHRGQGAPCDDFW
jgi:hypothetical protein